MPKREAHNRAGAAGTSGVLVWGCACMYVCLYVCPLRIYDWNIRVYAYFTYLFGTCRSWCNRTRDGGRGSGGQNSTPESVQRYRSWLTTLLKDDSRQDNGDRRWLLCQHPSDLLCLLTREQDKQRTARRHRVRPRMSNPIMSSPIMSNKMWECPKMSNALIN